MINNEIFKGFPGAEFLPQNLKGFKGKVKFKGSRVGGHNV